MSNQAATPEPIGLTGVRSVALPAEHGIVELEAPTASPSVGDPLEADRRFFGHSNLSSRHDEMYGIRNDRVETVWPILARGKLR